MSTIGNRLKKIRTEKHLTQMELGQTLSVSKQAVANVESGHNNPSIEFISKLIEILNVNSNWLITGKGEMFSHEFEDVKDEVLEEVDKILIKYGIKKQWIWLSSQIALLPYLYRMFSLVRTEFLQVQFLS